MKSIHIAILLLGTLGIVFSCNKKQENTLPERNLIAKVNNNKIFKKDIINMLPKNISSEDSAKYVSEYLQQWVAEQAMYAKAIEVLTDTNIIEQKIEKYRQQLYIYYFTQNFVYNNVNYDITEKEIEDYYNKHLKDYVLSQTYVKAHYLTMDTKAYSYYSERDKLFSSTLEDKEELEDFCIGTKRKVYFVEEWTEIGEFLNKVKFTKTFDPNELLFKSTFEHIAGDVRYLIKYDDYKTIGDYMPIEIAKDNIVQIIINNRKRDKLIQAQNELIEEGLNSGYITINNNKE